MRFDKYASNVKAFTTCKARPTPNECPTMHTSLLPYFFTVVLTTSSVLWNLQEPLRSSIVKILRSCMSLLIVAALRRVPLRAIIAFGSFTRSHYQKIRECSIPVQFKPCSKDGFIPLIHQFFHYLVFQGLPPFGCQRCISVMFFLPVQFQQICSLYKARHHCALVIFILPVQKQRRFYFDRIDARKLP